MVRDVKDIPSLLERGAQFVAKLRDTRQKLTTGATLQFAAATADAFVAAHRSQRDPGTLTRFAHGDARQPATARPSRRGCATAKI